MSTEDTQKSILKVLVYADIFEWPVRENEIGVGKNILKRLISGKKIGYKNNFYFLYSKDKLVERRLQREKWAEEKMLIARKAAERLKIIPSILLIGVSGGLAIGNVGKDDDIDFFIICRNGTLWMTRFLSMLLLELLGRRRRPNDRKFKDKICLNMFVDEEGMAVPKPEQDIYTGHEIGNLKVLWEKEGVYRKFIEANKWAKNYLNFQFSIFRQAQDCPEQSRRTIFNFQSIINVQIFNDQLRINIFEKIFRWLQLRYMRGRRTREKIESHRLLFHPEDKRKEILDKYQQKLKALKM